MKSLVIGSNSFSGSNFVNFLLNKKHKVIGVSRSKEYKSVYLRYKNNKFIKNFFFQKIDLNNDLNKLFNLILKIRPDFIINFSAQGMVAESWRSPEDWYKTNTLSTIKAIFVINASISGRLCPSSRHKVGAAKSNRSMSKLILRSL